MNLELLHTLVTHGDKILEAFKAWDDSHDKSGLKDALRRVGLFNTETARANLKNLDNLNVARIGAILKNGLTGVTSHLDRARIPDTNEVDKHVANMRAAFEPLHDALSIRRTKLKQFGLADVEIPDDANEAAVAVEKRFKSIEELQKHVFLSPEQTMKKQIAEQATEGENLLMAVSIERMETFIAESVRKIQSQLSAKGLGTKVPFVIVEGPVIVKTRLPIEAQNLDRAGIEFSYLNNAASMNFWKKENTSTDKMRQTQTRISRPITSNFVILPKQTLIAFPPVEKINLIPLADGKVFHSKAGTPKKSKGYAPLTVEEILAILKARTGKTYINLMREIPETVKHTQMFKGKAIRNDDGEKIGELPVSKRGVVKHDGKRDHTLMSAKSVSAQFLWIIDRSIYNKLGPIQLERVSIPF